jgi:3-deoxy-D-manno-octulosonic-acid transferase
LRVADAAQAMREANGLSTDAARRQSMGAKGLAFVAAHRGAVERLAGWISSRAKASG